METKPETTTAEKSKAKRPSPKLDELGEGIPVKSITFDRAKTNCNMPDGSFGLSLIKNGDNGQGVYTLSWFPQVRGIRVDFVPRNKEKEPSSYFVHESWCIWEV
jgi:hypothetical protein